VFDAMVNGKMRGWACPEVGADDHAGAPPGERNARCRCSSVPL